MGYAGAIHESPLQGAERIPILHSFPTMWSTETRQHGTLVARACHRLALMASLDSPFSGLRYLSPWLCPGEAPQLPKFFIGRHCGASLPPNRVKGQGSTPRTPGAARQAASRWLLMASR